MTPENQHYMIPLYLLALTVGVLAMYCFLIVATARSCHVVSAALLGGHHSRHLRDVLAVADHLSVELAGGAVRGVDPPVDDVANVDQLLPLVQFVSCLLKQLCGVVAVK